MEKNCVLTHPAYLMPDFEYIRNAEKARNTTLNDEKYDVHSSDGAL